MAGHLHALYRRFAFARSRVLLIAIALLCSMVSAGLATGATVEGRVVDPKGNAVEQASVTLSGNNPRTPPILTDGNGRFSFRQLRWGTYVCSVSAPGFTTATRRFVIEEGSPLTLEISLTILAGHESINVADNVYLGGILSPDPTQQLIMRDESLDANPGRPGAPVSIPGLPIESASGGIKAPQYFAPGVAGDHGEPIAQYIQVGSFLFSNNLSANAHGNGYADPNILVPDAIASVQTDGGAFNVREGNHSENLSETYGLHPQLEPFATITGDYRDADLVAGWSPGSSSHAWVLLQASYGNGFLDRLEHRQQYKFNAFRSLEIANHTVALFAVGYYGFSYIPGLTPIHTPQLHDTIDPRQRDQTHTGLLVANDTWKLTSSQQLLLSGFFRTYNLALDSNFGEGLIRQSEFRTVTGGNLAYTNILSKFLTLFAGIDFQRDAPRRLDLDRYLSNDVSVYGLFQPVTANNVTIGDFAPHIAIGGTITPYLRYYAGFRRDQVGFDNVDLLSSANSSDRSIGLNSPKATVSFVPSDHSPLPLVSCSAGEAFFTNDPRIGSAIAGQALVSRSHSFQLVAEKKIAGTDIRFTLGHVTTEATLAKLDPDTGLPYDQGPGRLRFLTISARRYLRNAMLQASVSKADARDADNGMPTPEAPRTIFDVLGTWDKVPFRLQARGEFEYAGANPLGDSLISVPVKEFRFALIRSFADGRMSAGVNLAVATGYTGQTTEVLSLGEAVPSERIVGVRNPSYVSLSYSYNFRARSIK